MKTPQRIGGDDRGDARSDGTERDGLVDALVQASFRTMAVLSRVAAEHELSLTQFRVLAILRGRRLRMASLAEYLGLEKSTMTGLVDRAEKRGLLVRAPGANDGRSVDVSLSAAGAELAGRVSAEVARSLAPMTHSLASARQRTLQSGLERMLDGSTP